MFAGPPSSYFTTSADVAPRADCGSKFVAVQACGPVDILGEGRKIQHRIESKLSAGQLLGTLSTKEDGRMRFCPLCHGILFPKDIRVFRFDCPHCLKTLTPCFFPGYMWIRALVCLGAGVT